MQRLVTEKGSKSIILGLSNPKARRKRLAKKVTSTNRETNLQPWRNLGRKETSEAIEISKSGFRIIPQEERIGLCVEFVFVHGW